MAGPRPDQPLDAAEPDRRRRAVARLMAQDRRGMERSRFAITVVGKLLLLEAEGGR